MYLARQGADDRMLRDPEESAGSRSSKKPASPKRAAASAKGSATQQQGPNPCPKGGSKMPRIVRARDNCPANANDFAFCTDFCNTTPRIGGTVPCAKQGPRQRRVPAIARCTGGVQRFFILDKKEETVIMAPLSSSHRKSQPDGANYDLVLVEVPECRQLLPVSGFIARPHKSFKRKPELYSQICQPIFHSELGA